MMGGLSMGGSQHLTDAWALWEGTPSSQKGWWYTLGTGEWVVVQAFTLPILTPFERKTLRFQEIPQLPGM